MKTKKPDNKTNPGTYQDHIEGEKIVLFDFFGPVSKVLKTIEIYTKKGKRTYQLKKTAKGGYLFN
jgi:hypothetical protein